MTKIILILLTVLTATINTLYGQSKYQNDKYGFSGQVPDDWHVYAEIKDDPANKKAIIDWGLPKVYSKLEKTSIENAVSITAYKKPDIKTIDDLIKFEFERIGHVLVSKELNDTIQRPSYVVITLRNGLNYKSKVAFVFQNNIGYVLSFTATPGTYDLNISKFDSFVNDLQFFEPKESKQQTASKADIRFDGLYVVKTGELNIPNNKMGIYTYIRFYDDGTVYTQAVNSYDPKKVSEWFGKDGRFERKGTYKIDGAGITFTVTNDESPDKQLEGAKTDKYGGKITDQNKLFLEVKYESGEFKDFWFEFAKVN
ncbi:MAG: hypothetical protein JKX73_02990 [Flavobacteriales bacterium]|nr:hypothetical protein [Flavobacteriales bacterium]